MPRDTGILWMRWAILVAGLLLSAVRAQQVQPANASVVNASDPNTLQIIVSHDAGSYPLGMFPVMGLTSQARQSTPQQDERLRGTILLANASNQLSIALENVVIMSCDPYGGNIQPSSVFTRAAELNVTAILLYSTSEGACSLDSGTSDYDWVYSTNGASSANDLLALVASTSNAYGTIAPRSALPDQQNGTSNQGNASNQNPLGPSPSTAVAMIILYSITGVITALFLIIIFTGAVRAHRHPERYGPRNGVGRPRQSRARGLARAMLDTIPIVKFGDREGDQAKPQRDVELAEGSQESAEASQGAQGEQARSAEACDVPAESTTGDSGRSPAETDDAQEAGIAAAMHREHAPMPPENQGCSICTDDFEVGQDQRVLPCDHRFHPECIDPWLLNVSGTCPLCRIDLRPPNSRPSVDEVDEHGNPIAQNGANGLAPPLESDARRLSVRRSIMLGLMGIRPERLSREDRVHALRRYRDHQAAAQQSEEAGHETSTRQRLRNAFRIRTRRTGEDGRLQDVPEHQEPDAPADPSPRDVTRA